MALPKDYLERVYAGVLGKIIGVFLGRPVEGWSCEKITERYGELSYYVHAGLGRQVVETDDDISGTFTFLRALPDCGNRPDVTAEEMGRAWLNYLIEERTVLWWGGLGSSTEHTAYLRLKAGIPAPRSGAVATNGRIIAEQIGAQIFIDGWGMVSPGDPGRAAELARRAGSVSHDGEAVYGAQVIAAIEAQAFVEKDLSKLIDGALRHIPKDSHVRKVIDDLREWRESTPDWRAAQERLAVEYPYERFGGGCPMVPNHGVVILSLLYGDGDFGRTLMIANTCGWDTDCNSGNAGCIMGIRNGLAGIDSGADFRGPVADRLLIPTADAGGGITDAARIAVSVANIGRALAGEKPLSPKAGARFHFELPGSVQGWRPEEDPDSSGTCAVENVTGHSAAGGRSLAIRYRALARGRCARAFTDTFVQPSAGPSAGTYRLFASPTIYPGQIVKAVFSADEANASAVQCRLYAQHYGPEEKLVRLYGPATELAPGRGAELEWDVPATGRGPVARVGLELSSRSRSDGVVYLDWLTWRGEPLAELGPTEWPGDMWRRAWVDGVDNWNQWHRGFRLNQNSGTGLLIQGTREWANYRATAAVKTDLAAAAGIAVRVQGMRRYYAMLLVPGGKARLVRRYDDEETTLAEREVGWEPGKNCELSLEARRGALRGRLDGLEVLAADDSDGRLPCGAAAFVISEGQMASDLMKVEPVLG